MSDRLIMYLKGKVTEAEEQFESYKADLKKPDVFKTDTASSIVDKGLDHALNGIGYLERLVRAQREYVNELESQLQNKL